jgi:hypothetical protein
MPTKRTKRRVARHGDIETSPRIRELLDSGVDFEVFDASLGPEGELDPDLLREVWDDLGDQLLAEHIASAPGTRPWAWWQWESPEPRRQVNPGPEPIGPAAWFGMPSQYKGQPPDGMYESEAAYLARHSLLTNEERNALKLD